MREGCVSTTSTKAAPLTRPDMYARFLHCCSRLGVVGNHPPASNTATRQSGSACVVVIERTSQGPFSPKGRLKVSLIETKWRRCRRRSGHSWDGVRLAVKNCNTPIMCSHPSCRPVAWAQELY
ncbi:hypothetical protein TRVL_08963 [Trypanosoma vivax]|nr:hypothetical protein TRVL_08963 [Trypanosoma vivax]